MHRFLLVAPIYAMSVSTGGGQRTFHISKSLAALGQVDLLIVSESTFADLESTFNTIKSDFAHVQNIFIQRSTEQFILAPQSNSGYFATISYFIKRLMRSARPRGHFYRPTSDALASLLALAKKNNYSAIVGRYLQPTALSGAFGQKNIPVLVDLDDLEEKIILSRLASRETSKILRTALQLQLRQILRILKILRGKSAHLFAASEADKLFTGSSRCSVLPNIPLTHGSHPAVSPRPDSTKLLLFVGSYIHGANRVGIQNFVDRSWPDIKKALPSARFRIVGSGGWESQRSRLESISGVEVAGAVADLASEYHAAALCVVPIDEGSGTKIKVLEALMYSRAVVASEHSAHGYEELIGNGVTTANGPAQMAAVCVKMLLDPDACDLLGRTGSEIVEQRYSAESVSQAVKAGLVSAGVEI